MTHDVSSSTNTNNKYMNQSIKIRRSHRCSSCSHQRWSHGSSFPQTCWPPSGALCRRSGSPGSCCRSPPGRSSSWSPQTPSWRHTAAATDGHIRPEPRPRQSHATDHGLTRIRRHPSSSAGCVSSPPRRRNSTLWNWNRHFVGVKLKTWKCFKCSLIFPRDEDDLDAREASLQTRLFTRQVMKYGEENLSYWSRFCWLD